MTNSAGCPPTGGGLERRPLSRFAGGCRPGRRLLWRAATRSGKDIPAGGRSVSANRAFPGGDPQVLSNHSVAGSGNFVTGQFGPLTLEGGTERWFEFTTLGDGTPGTYVAVLPVAEEARSLLVRPSDGAVVDGEIDRTSDRIAFEGDVRPQWVMELDLGTLLPYMAEIGTEFDLLTALQLQLDYVDFAQALPYDSSMPLSSPPIALNGKLIFPSQRIRLCSKHPLVDGRYGRREHAHRVLFGRIAGHPQPHMGGRVVLLHRR